MKLTWYDISRMALNKINKVETVTLDDINDNILDYLEVKYCYQCEHSSYCHKEATKCDDMFSLLESIGFEQ